MSLGILLAQITVVYMPGLSLTIASIGTYIYSLAYITCPTRFPLNMVVAGVTHISTISGLNRLKFGGIKYMKGIFSCEVGRGTCECY